MAGEGEMSFSQDVRRRWIPSPTLISRTVGMGVSFSRPICRIQLFLAVISNTGSLAPRHTEHPHLPAHGLLWGVAESPPSLSFASDSACQVAGCLFVLSHCCNISRGDLLFQKKTNKQAVFANRDGMLEHLWNGFLPVLFVDHLFPSIGAWKDRACPMQLPYAKYHLPGKQSISHFSFESVSFQKETLAHTHATPPRPPPPHIPSPSRLQCD